MPLHLPLVRLAPGELLRFPPAHLSPAPAGVGKTAPHRRCLPRKKFRPCGAREGRKNSGAHGPTQDFPDPQEARMRQAMDAMKLGLSVRHGVQVVVILPQDLTLAGMRGKIEGVLPVRDVREGDPVAQYLGKRSAAYMRACRRRRTR